jgi:hypothetical protein
VEADVWSVDIGWGRCVRASIIAAEVEEREHKREEKWVVRFTAGLGTRIEKLCDGDKCVMY